MTDPRVVRTATTEVAGVAPADDTACTGHHWCWRARTGAALLVTGGLVAVLRARRRGR